MIYMVIGWRFALPIGTEIYSSSVLRRVKHRLVYHVELKNYCVFESKLRKIRLNNKFVHELLYEIPTSFILRKKHVSTLLLESGCLRSSLNSATNCMYTIRWSWINQLFRCAPLTVSRWEACKMHVMLVSVWWLAIKSVLPTIRVNLAIGTIFTVLYNLFYLRAIEEIGTSFSHQFTFYWTFWLIELKQK